MTPTIPVFIFAKPPVPGLVKTRLALPGRAAELARAFLIDTYVTIQDLGWASPIVATTGDLDARLRAVLAPTVWPQGDGDLGARLERVLRRALEHSPAAIAVGADSPALPIERYEEARAALATSDAVIGPSEDGGFYLLAVKRCPDGLLADLPWSTAGTFAATVARLRARGLTVATLAPWFDVDHPADLERLRRELAARPEVALATRQALAGPRLSVVMPVLNEEKRIAAALAAVVRLPGVDEVIVVDGGSTDSTVELAATYPVRVVSARRGRGPQLNAGAAQATGDVVLFLHADTTLPHDTAAHVRSALARPGVVAGAFRTWTIADEARPWFAPLLHLADLRSRTTRFPYGDQAMFVRADVFRRVGGFPDVPLMEDLELSRRLWRHGRIHTCRASVRVSGRRFVARPIVFTTLVNVFPLLHRAGVSPHTLARFYAQVR